MSTAHFDKQAVEWDDNPGRVENARKIAVAIRQSVPLDKTMRALEFGCGTGLISRELFPMLGPERSERGSDADAAGQRPEGVATILAIDLSPGMIAQLQKRIAEAGLQNITAKCLDIFKSPPAGPFDLIFSGMALHHVPDTDALLKALTGLLAPGGFIALADLDTEDETFHGEDAGPVHHGFDRKEMIHKIRTCGVVEITTITVNSLHKNGRDYPVFLLTARKPAE